MMLHKLIKTTRTHTKVITLYLVVLNYKKNYFTGGLLVQIEILSQQLNKLTDKLTIYI